MFLLFSAASVYSRVSCVDVSTLVSENATVIQDISFLVFIVLLSLGILKVIGKLLIGLIWKVKFCKNV